MIILQVIKKHLVVFTFIFVILLMFIVGYCNRDKKPSIAPPPAVESSITEEQRKAAIQENKDREKLNTAISKFAINLHRKYKAALYNQYNYQILAALKKAKFTLIRSRKATAPDGNAGIEYYFRKEVVEVVNKKPKIFVINFSYIDGYDLTAYMSLSVDYIDANDIKTTYPE